MLLRLLVLALASSAPRPSSALSYGPSFLQEPPPTVLYSNNTGLVLESVFLGKRICLTTCISTLLQISI